MDNPTKKRVSFRVELTTSSKEKLVEVSQKFGMKQCTVLERLTTWFARQEKTIQGIVLGFYTQSVERQIARFLRKNYAKQKVA